MAPVAAAVLPHPPLLVPELAGAAAPELDPLRAACREALSTVVAAADLTLVIGVGSTWAIPAPTATGSFHPYGAEVAVTLPALADIALPALADPDLPALTDVGPPGVANPAVPGLADLDPPGVAGPALPGMAALDIPVLPAPARLGELPLSLAVAAHLLANLGPPPGAVAGADRPSGAGQLWAATVPRSLGPRAAAAIGRALNSAGRFGLVVMADLSACRTERAPGAFRPDAADFDARVGDAFRAGAPHRLLALDPAQAADLRVAGRVPLQVLAGTFAPDPAPGDPPDQGRPPSGRDRSGDRDLAAGPRRQDETLPGVRGRVLYEGAPYGVGYLVALLTAP
jgi:hypothetical protein